METAKTEEKKKKAWFGKRWTKSGVSALDSLIFDRPDYATEEREKMETMASSFCVNITLGIICGIILVVASLVDDQEQMTKICGWVAGVASMIASGFYLRRTLGYFPTMGVRVGRAIYVIVLNLVACGVGVIIGVYTAVVIAVILIIWLVLEVATSDNKGQVRRI